MRWCACAASLVLAFTCAGARAQPEQPMREIEVREGDDCRRIAERELGDPQAIGALHRANPELGPLPHRLVPGTRLRIPALGAPAHLSAVVRRVERRPPDLAVFEEARRGQPLPRSTHVRTHDRSSAEITFLDGTEVTIRERTLVIVYGGARRLTQRTIGHAELERGALRSRMPELAGRDPLEVDTPSSRASLQGAGVVSVEDDGTSRVANHGRRAATIVAAGRRLRLPADTGTVVRRGEPPSAPRPLLAAPRWRADREGAVIGFVDRGAVLSGGFDRVAGASRYRVEIARRPDGAELTAVLELGGDADRFEAAGIAEGTHYVSIASVDPARLEGRRSPWRAFTVRLARLVAPGGASIDPDPEPPRVVVGTWFVAPRGLVCDDRRSQGTLLTLRAPGTHAIRCTDAAGHPLAPLVVEVLAPSVALRPTELVRDRTTPIEIVARDAPPATALILRGPEGFRITGVRADGGRLRADVLVPIDARSRGSLRLEVLAGTERVPIARLPFVVRAPSEIAIASAPDVQPRFATGVLADLGWPSTLSLRDERRDGFGAWTSAAIVENGAQPLVRVGVGARATLPGAPLRVGFASQLDAFGSAGAVDRRGSGDLLASVGASIARDPRLALAADVSVWIPTRGEPESLGRARLAPSLEGSLRIDRFAIVRMRQGALIDAIEDGARAWASAIGGDLTPIDGLAIGAELDATIGRFADRNGAALGLGAAIEGRVPPLELGIGARLALTDEARALWGAWMIVAGVRVFGE